MRVAWEQINGKKFEGEFVELDNGTAIVKMDDGTQKAVDAESLILASEKHYTKGGINLETAKLSASQMEYRVKMMSKANLTIGEREAFRQILDSYTFLEKENSDLRMPYEQKHTNDADESCICERCLRADRGGI